VRPQPSRRVAPTHRSTVARSVAGLTAVALLAFLALFAGAPAFAQEIDATGEELVSLDFSDVELPVVVDTISRMTGYNFIYDDRVRGRVTIVSPTQVTVDQAFAVFESVLKVKGFSLVLGPGDTYKIIPIRDVKESSIDTIKDGRPSRNRDRFVTRLVPLRYIDAAGITQTIKPLISKDASLVAYAPTNTIIVTDSESNIRRLLSILDAIDVESYRQELAVIKIEHADANTLGEQLSEIYGAEVSSTAGGGTASQRRTRSRRNAQTQANAVAAAVSGGLAGPSVRILTDERTNSLLVLSSRQQLVDIRELVRKLDIPVTGGGRIHVYYLRHADSEELSETLNALLSGASGGGGGGSGAGGGAANVQALRSTVTPLAEGLTVTADPATNSLVIQASKEAYETLRGVIDKLDVSRPQVLVEALIVEVDVTDRLNLGFSTFFRIINGDTDLIFSTGASILSGGAAGAIPGLIGGAQRITSFTDPADATDPGARPDRDGTSNMRVAISAEQADADLNIVSAPHILTSDNEEAEIRIGQNIPIVTGRTDAATGNDALSSAVQVERQDIGVTLRVTPQISEGDTLRLQIFQELTEVTDSEAGDVNEVGVTLTSRKVENTVVVNDGETVAIGGLISEAFTDAQSGVPWLSEIPYLGWLFKVKSQQTRKINLIVFLTPHIVRSAEDLEQETIRKRLEIEEAYSDESVFPELARYGQAPPPGRSTVDRELHKHGARYPVERMRELEQQRAERRSGLAVATGGEPQTTLQSYAVRVATFLDENAATDALTSLLDAGYDGTLVATESGGRLVYSVEVGPFDELNDAERTGEILDAAYGYSTSVNVQRRDEQ